MALFEHDIEHGRVLSSRGATSLNRLLPTSLIGKRFKSGSQLDQDSFSGRLMKDLTTGNNNVLKTNNRIAKQTGMIALNSRDQLRISTSHFQFFQRQFKLNKNYLTDADKWFKLDKDIKSQEEQYYEHVEDRDKKQKQRLKKLDQKWERWRHDMLKAMKDTRDNTQTMQTTQRIRTASTVTKAGFGIIGNVLAPLFAIFSRGTGRLARSMYDNSGKVIGLTTEMKGLARSLRRLSRELSPDAMFGEGSRAENRAARRAMYAENDATNELLNRGYTKEQIGELEGRTGMSKQELAADRAYDNRTRRERFKAKLRIGGSEGLLGRRGLIAGGARGAGRAAMMPFKAVGAAGRGLGKLASFAGKFAPGIGALVGAGAAIQQAKKGDYFGAAVSGIGGVASAIPGLGPFVQIALESLSSLLPQGIKDSFNKWAGPYFEKAFKSLTSGETGKNISEIISAFGDAMESVWTIIKKTVLSPAMIQVYKSFGWVILKYGVFIAKGIRGIFGFIADVFKGEKGIGQAITDNLLPIVKSAWCDVIMTVGNEFVAVTKAVLGGIPQRIWDWWKSKVTFGFLKSDEQKAAEAKKRATREKERETAVKKALGGTAGIMERRKPDLQRKLDQIQLEKDKIARYKREQEGLDPNSRVFKAKQKSIERSQKRIDKITNQIGQLPGDQSKVIQAIKEGGDVMAAYDTEIERQRAKETKTPTPNPSKGKPTTATAKPPATTPPGGTPTPTPPTTKPGGAPTTTPPAPGGGIGAGGKGMGMGFQFENQSLDKDLQEAATKYGVNLGFLRTMARIESGGNPNAVSPTGCTGIFQFCKDTGKAYGLFPGGVDMRKDQHMNVMAGARLAADNASALSAAGVPPTPANLYMAHQEGAGGAIQLFRAAVQGGAVTPDVIANMGHNGRLPGETPAAFYRRWQKKWDNMAGTPGTVKGIGGGAGGGYLQQAENYIGGVYQKGKEAYQQGGLGGLMGAAAGGAIGMAQGLGGAMGGIAQGLIAKGTAEIGSIVEGMGLAPNIAGGSLGAIGGAITGAVGAAVGEASRMSEAMSMVFSGDPNMQSMANNISQMTGHTGSIANAQNNDKSKIDPNEDVLLQMFQHMGMEL